MADGDDVIENTPDQGTLGDGSAGEGQAVQPKLIFGKYKDEGEAEKAYKEAERKMAEEARRASDLSKELEQVRQQANLAKAIESLASKSNQPETKANDYQQFLEKLEQETREDPVVGVKRTLETASGWVSDVERKTSARVDEVVKRLAGEIESLREQVEKTQPDYLENREMIDTLVSGGMKLSAAREFAKGLSTRIKAEQPGRVTPPISASSGSRGSAAMETAYLSAEERADMKRDGFTDAMIAEMEATERRNRENEKAERARLAKGI